jgi:hypothetical protein
MSCQEQSALRASGTPKYVAINLHYIGSQPTCFLGPVTGNVYEFSPVQPIQSVDPRDAVDLLVNRQLRLAR